MSSPVTEYSVPSTPPAPDNDVPIGTPGEDDVPLQPPTPLPNLTPPTASPRDSLTPSANAPLVPETEKSLEENSADVDEPSERPRPPLLRRPIVWFGVAAAVAAVVLAVVLPVYFTVIKPKNNTSSGGGGNSNGGSEPKPPPNGVTTGGDGSTVTMDNGTEFTYRNPFGGFCTWSPFSRLTEGDGLTVGIVGVWDPRTPFNDNAQPNSWTPPLNTTWKWGVDKLYG